MKLNTKIFSTSLVVMIILLLAIGCKTEVAEVVYIEDIEKMNEDTEILVSENLQKVKIEMEDGGIMVFELYPQYAPETVANFLELVEAGFYDGLKFHRIMKGFMAQSGDPLGNGSGGADKTIKGEFAMNGFDQNTLIHVKGVLSMARSTSPDSASSQFFIMDGTNTSLDGSYAAFGMLIEGEDVLDTITATEVKRDPRGEMSVPVTDVIIKSIIIQ